MFKINSLEELQDLSNQVKWQYFEKLVGWIFEQNDFSVKLNFVSKKPKRQYDLIAKRFGKVFLVECKKWKGGRYKSSRLRDAVEKHIERCELFTLEKEKTPLIVTLMNEDIQSYRNVNIVPIGVNPYPRT